MTNKPKKEVIHAIYSMWNPQCRSPFSDSLQRYNCFSRNTCRKNEDTIKSASELETSATVMMSERETMPELFSQLCRATINTCVPRREDIFSHYYLNGSKDLGHGRFGNVRTAVDKITGEKVAVKRIPKSYTTELMITDEVYILQSTSHKNIIQYRAFYADQKYWYIAMELARGEELYERLAIGGLLSKDQSISVLHQLVDALAYLHRMGIVHGDVKPENIVFNEHKDGRVTIKLADFGSSFYISDNVVPRRQHTPVYSPPEVIIGAANLNKSADVWACGIIAYILFRGSHPFDSTGQRTDRDLIHNILHGKPDFSGVWHGIAKSVITLMKRALGRNPKKRPTTQKMLTHTWLSSQFK